MSLDTRPAALETEAGRGRIDDLRVAHPTERVQLLRSVMDRNVVVTLHGSDGTAYTSTLWSVDPEQQRVSFTADLMAPALHRLVEAEDVVAVCFLDQIRLQFDVTARMLVHGAQACVLQARLPAEVYRFQRRQAFRVRTLERSVPRAVFRHPALPDMLLELRVLDLSVGGCALFLPEDVPPIEPGLELRGVRIELDLDTDFHVGLHIHHVTAIQPQAAGCRLGCEITQITPDAQRLLQRYIDHTQKRRRMLSLD